MRFRHSLWSLAAVLACESDLTVSNVAVSLDITPAADTMVQGEAGTPFTAIALNFDNDTIAADVSWSVRHPTLANIHAPTGTISALAVGETWVIAETGSLLDSARLTILGPITLALRLDTILLAPNDTFTIPVSSLNLSGAPLNLTYAIADTGVARVAGDGRLTAVAAGRTAFTVQADTITLGGIVDVINVLDTLGGEAYFVMQGAVNRRVRLPTRWFQYPNGVGGSILNIPARSADDLERFFVLARDSLTGPGTRALGPFPATTASAAVCNPPNGWALYQDRRTGSVDVPSAAPGGTLSIQRVDPLPGGSRISATVDVTLELTPGNLVTVLGRFVAPLVSLPGCPG